MEEILKYFEEDPHRITLRVVDNKYREKYLGVTLNYITYDLLKAKYKKSKVAEWLLKLHKAGEIKSIFCPNVNNYTFCKASTTNGNFDPETGGPSVRGYRNYTEGYNLHEYLKQFIKNE